MFEHKSIMDRLTGAALVEGLVGFLEEKCEDFPEIHRNYREAIGRMEKGNALAAAIDAQMASDLLFSAALGLGANLDHFRDPVARTFLEVEPEIYLRESVAHRLPQYLEAQKIRDSLEENEAVTAYIITLETMGPKLAHYAGYLLGDRLLPKIVPGYSPDPGLTLGYREWICGYMGMEAEPESEK